MFKDEVSCKKDEIWSNLSNLGLFGKKSTSMSIFYLKFLLCKNFIIVGNSGIKRGTSPLCGSVEVPCRVKVGI